MDLELKIKEEPAWLEGKTTASLENIELVSEVIALKEVKSELTESGSMEENSLEPFEDIKEEICIEEHTDDQLLPYIKEETESGPEVSYANRQVPDGGATSFSCSVCGKVLVGKLGLLRHLKTHKDDRPYQCDHCGKLFGCKSSLSEHLKIHPLLLCGFCHKCFTKRNMLEEHKCLHTSMIENECSGVLMALHEFQA
ncbi:zinc finger protein OZF-like [Anabrus simplex]|uniref:zinc finger protein OZF-like n=1 Tax=Anabrus simplex TaxID=316456 RepID=UPI0035A2750C